MNDAGEESGARASLPVVCRLLRTKTAFGSMQPGAPEWQRGESTTVQYWCLQTMESAGVDNGYAHPETCREGRRCFARPIE